MGCGLAPGADNKKFDSKQKSISANICDVSLIQPRFFIYILNLIVVTILSFILFAVFVDYTQTEKVHGILSQKKNSGPLYAVLQVSPSVLVKLKVGMEIDLVYRDYPEKIYGSYEASIKSWSDTPILMQDSTSIFEVWATLDDQAVSAKGKNLKLLSNMPFSTRVSFETKNILSWLLDSFKRDHA